VAGVNLQQNPSVDEFGYFNSFSQNMLNEHFTVKIENIKD